MLAHLALGALFLTVALSIWAVRVRVGPLPLRTACLLSSGALLFSGDGRLLTRSLHDLARLLLVLVLCALLALIVSLVASASPAEIFQQLLELHLQAMIGSIIAYGLVLRFGVARVAVVLLIPFGISAVVALAQSLGLDAAWRARAFFGALMHDPPITQDFYVRRYRALGLSYSPVLFGTQICVALAAFYYLRLGTGTAPRKGIDWMLMAVLALALLLSIATGNRSPIMGMLAFVAVYVLVRAPGKFLVALPLIFLALLAIGPLMDVANSAGVRVARTEDGSAAGRSTLLQYGLHLLARRPFGYGLTFNSVDYWQSFVSQARYLENPMAIRQWPLHNYYINVLLKHGVLVLMFIPLIVPWRKRTLLLWMPFLPYMIHVFFHNDGPLQGDFLVFYVIAAGIYLARQPAPEDEPDKVTVSTAKRPKRAFARPETKAA